MVTLPAEIAADEEDAPENAQFEGRSYHYQERIEKLMRLDFEMLNTVLGVELNIQMSPMVLRSVLRRRLSELTVEEKRGLPEIVVEVILSVDGDHSAKEFEKYLKKPKSKPKKKPEPKRAEALPVPMLVMPVADQMKLTSVKDGVSIVMEGMRPVDILRALVKAKPWTSWCYFNKIRVKVGDRSLDLFGQIFADFTLEEIRGMIRERFSL